MAIPPSGFARIKLQLMYLIDKADLPVSGEQLIRACSKYDWLNYFELQQALSEMADSRLAVQAQFPSGRRGYQLSALGKQTLECFEKEIPFSIRRALLADAEVLKRESKVESECSANYYKQEDGRYIAHLQVFEGKEILMDIRLSMPAMAQAKAACETWAGSASAVYSLLMQGISDDYGSQQSFASAFDDPELNS